MHTAKERGVLPKDFDRFAPYTIKYQNKDLLMKNEEYGDVPLYIEHMSMSEEDLSDIMDEYEKIRVEHFQYSDFYLSRLKHHLTPRNFVKIPPKELFVKELSHYYGKPKYCDETKIAIMKNKKIILKH